MGAQHPAILEVEGVVHGPRRMMGRDIERLEVVVVVLDLGAFRDLEAELAEQCLDARQRPGDGVQPARAAAAPGQGHVQALFRQAPLQGLPLQIGLARFDGRLQPLLGLVDDGPGHLALLGRQAAELLQPGRQAALLAEVLHTDGVQRLQVAGSRYGLLGLIHQLRDFFLHESP